jgi:hypothetical protein
MLESSPFIKWIVVASVIAFASMKKACAQEDITRKPASRQSDNNIEPHRSRQLGGFFVGGFPLNYVEQEGEGFTSMKHSSCLMPVLRLEEC